MIDPLELHAYADGELDKQSAERVRQQLQQDSASQAELDCIQNLKVHLKQNCPDAECSEAWKACLGRLNELDKVKRTEGFVGKYAWALCGVFFLFILAGGIVSRMGGSNMGSQDLARAVASLGPVSRPSSNDAEAKRRLIADTLIGEASNIISPATITTKGFDVMGAASGQIDGRRVGQLALRDRQGDVTVLIVNSALDLSKLPDAPGSTYKASKLQGVNCVAWTDHDLTLVVAADRPYEELVQTAGNIVVGR